MCRFGRVVCSGKGEVGGEVGVMSAVAGKEDEMVMGLGLGLGL